MHSNEQLWLEKLEASGDLSSALQSLKVNAAAAEEIATARAALKWSGPLEEQLQLTSCWLNGLGLGLCSSENEADGDLEDTLASLLMALNSRSASQLAEEWQIDFDDLTEISTSCALAIVEPNLLLEAAALCCEGMLTGIALIDNSKKASLLQRKVDR
jgi:hypothetical protein